VFSIDREEQSRIPGSKAGAEVRSLDGVRQRSVVCGKGAIFAEATTQPHLPHLDPTQIRRLEAAPARPVTLLSSSEQYAEFPKSPAQDGLPGDVKQN